MRKILMAGAAVVAAVAVKIGIDRVRRPTNRQLRMPAGMNGQAHHLTGRAKGLAYRALRRHPDADVDDPILADRIRSSIGPLEKQLSVSRVHVTVEHGVAILHGEASGDAAEQIEQAVERIAGVRGVRSHLVAYAQQHLVAGSGSRLAPGFSTRRCPYLLNTFLILSPAFLSCDFFWSRLPSSASGLSLRTRPATSLALPAAFRRSCLALSPIPMSSHSLTLRSHGTNYSSTGLRCGAFDLLPHLSH